MPVLHPSRSLLPAAALALSLVLAGCGEDTDAPQATPTQETTDTSAAPQPSQRSSPTREAERSGLTLEITVSGDEVTPVGKAIEMSTDDPLTVVVTSDRAGELHVHSSPEQYVEFGQGRTRQQLAIDKPGQVDIEEHDSGAVVARLLVR
jgi:hypothetical protein